MESAGLSVNYSRAHPGQGTRNVCACLDDIFLELLWLDGSDISAESERITLGARGRGEGSPLGIAWRGDAHLDCEAYDALFLPAGVTIQVAQASLDPALPFLFQSPGGVAPIDRTDGLTGQRQRPHLSRLGRCVISAPNAREIEPLISGLPELELVCGPTGLHLTLLDMQGHPAREIEWSSPT